MFIKDGKRFNIDAAVTIGDVQYPAGFFRDPVARTEHGVTELAEPARGDERYYYNQELAEAPYLIVTPKPLDNVKDAVWVRIQAHRDTLQEQGVQVQGYWFHNDVKSRSQWERMVNNVTKLIAAGADAEDVYTIGGEPVYWKTMTGAYVQLTLSLVEAVVQAMELQEATIFKVAAMHESFMRALDNVEAIASYDWGTGWPPVYSA